MAQYVHDRFTSAGVPHVEIQPVDVLLSNPISSSLQLIDTTVSASDSAAVVFTATLSEDVLDLDTTSDTWYRNHTYSGCVPRASEYVYMLHAVGMLAPCMRLLYAWDGNTGHPRVNEKTD